MSWAIVIGAILFVLLFTIWLTMGDDDDYLL
jgi:hypothetical protein